MADTDRERWNTKWAALDKMPRPHWLLRDYAKLLTGGTAVDLACGLGQNSLWLARHGYQVLALDLSEVALRRGLKAAVTQQLAACISFVQQDLDVWRPPPASCDLIVVFRFLDRRLFPYLRAALRPGGLIFYQTLHQGARRRMPQANPAFLLAPGELVTHFAGWTLIHAQEDASHSELIARKQ
jgi:tellurite methyltransferase